MPANVVALVLGVWRTSPDRIKEALEVQTLLSSALRSPQGATAIWAVSNAPGSTLAAFAPIPSSLAVSCARHAVCPLPTT
jgi:hypothetical protein